MRSQVSPCSRVTARPSRETADTIYDQVAECLGQDGYRPRALFDRFRIEVLATTGDWKSQPWIGKVSCSTSL